MTSSINGRRDPEGAWALVWALAAILMAAALSHSCTPRIAERISIYHDTTYVERVRVDSIAQRDSVFIRERGDTVYIYKERVRDRWRLVRDTVTSVRIDSVAVEKPVPVYITHPLTRWQKAKGGAFWWLVGALGAALLWIFRKPLLKLIRR